MITVIFDGDCGICQELRRRAQALDRVGKLQFVAYQTADLDQIAPGITRKMVEQSVYAIRADGTRRYGARAFFEAMRYLPGVWGMIGAVGSLPIVSWLAEPCYRLVARNRGTISRWLGLTHCTLPENH